MMDNNESHLVPNLLILVGMLACGVNAFGGKVCHDSLDPIKFAKWKPMLKTYLLLCCGFNALLLLTVILCFIMQFAVYLTLAEGPEEQHQVLQGHGHAGTLLHEEDTGHDADRVPLAVATTTSGTGSNRVLSNVEGKYLMDSVPFSCCNPGSPRPCIQHHLTNNSAHYDYDHRIEELNIWTRGCREALFSYFSGMMNSIGILIITTIILESVDMAGLKYLCTA
ncbi:Peripherin-2, partial [Nibea albiflora]